MDISPRDIHTNSHQTQGNNQKPPHHHFNHNGIHVTPTHYDTRRTAKHQEKVENVTLMGNSTARLDNSLEFFTKAEFQHELQILPLFKYPNKGTQKATAAEMPTPHESANVTQSQDRVCSGQTRNKELSHKNNTCRIKARYKRRCVSGLHFHETPRTSQSWDRADSWLPGSQGC